MDRNCRNLMLLLVITVMSLCTVQFGYSMQVFKTYDHMLSYNTNEEFDDDTIHFFFNEYFSQMLFIAELNGEEKTVFFDTGTSNSLILFCTEETKPTGKEFIEFPLMGIDKSSKVWMTVVPVHIKTSMGTSDVKGFAVLKDDNSCEEEVTINRYDIMGLKGLGNGCFSFDFTKNQIYRIEDRGKIDTKEYIPVKCKFARGVLFIYPIINGVEYKCVFDTGNGGWIYILDAQRVENPYDTDLLYEGSYGHALSGLTENQHFIVAPQTTVELAGHEVKEMVMFMEKELSFNDVGLQYIKRFDWIIDKENFKVYAKPHVDEMPESFPNRYGISTVDGTLRVFTRLIDGNETFEIGDQIISVDGEEITKENIGYYYQLLFLSKDWSEFDIKVK